MERDIIRNDLRDDLEICMANMDSIFNILNHSEWDERIISDIGYAGKALAQDASRRVKEICDFIEKYLGSIEIERRGDCLPGEDFDGPIGVIFTASNILNETLREEYGLIRNVVLRIAPVRQTKRTLAGSETEAKAHDNDGQQPESKSTVTQ